MANIATAGTERPDSSFGRLRIAITILVAATALVHLFLGVNMAMVLTGPPAEAAANGGTTMVTILAFLFLCNVGGYVVLATGLYVPGLRRFQRVTRALLMGYAALTIVAYFLTHLLIHLGHSSAIDPIGLFDKTVEVALIVLLIVEDHRDRA